MISSQINEAEREYGEDGHVTIKIVRASASHPKSPVEAAPMYGAIIGCCGRAPAVHYFRDGQRCCPDGQVTHFDSLDLRTKITSTVHKIYSSDQ